MYHSFTVVLSRRCWDIIRMRSGFFRNVSLQKGWLKTTKVYETYSSINYTRTRSCIMPPSQKSVATLQHVNLLIIFPKSSDTISPSEMDSYIVPKRSENLRSLLSVKWPVFESSNGRKESLFNDQLQVRNWQEKQKYC